MKKLIAACLTLATLAGCSSVPMDESKPVHFTTGFWQAGYEQDGKFVNLGDAETKIAHVPAAAKKIKTAATWQIAGLAIDIASLAIALTTPSADYNHFDNARFYGALLGGLAGSAICNAVANDKRSDAAELYNEERFTITPKKPTTGVFLAPTHQGLIAGLNIHF